MKTILCSLFLISISAVSTTFAQGCSDSGFCTMGALRPDQIYPRKLNFRINSVELTQHIGHTKFGDWIHSTFLDANIGITRKTNLQFRLPAYTIIEGRMPTTRGWGDIFFSLSQNLLFKEKFQINATLGGKIYNKWSDNKKSDDGRSMPMYQQTSFGTNDLIIGLSISSNKWLVATGYQRALNTLANQFRPEDWTETSMSEIVEVYPTSAGLQRGDDMMFRVERNFRFSRLSFYTGILNLVRLTKDKTLDTSGNLVSVNGTRGLATNFLAGVRYRFNTHHSVKALWSVKLKERDVNPDGLARDFVGQVAYEIRF
jgi:hypothetical protein